MLKEALASDRLFAVAGLDAKLARETGRFEPPQRVATIGIVRACQKNDNGTSNLLLQGLARVEIVEIVREEPYRRVRIKALASEPGAEIEENSRLRETLARLLKTKQRLGGSVPGEFAQFLKTVHDPETFVDLAAFTLCDDAKLKQKLLETLDVHTRLQLYSARLHREIESLKFQRKLQGRLPDDRIERTQFCFFTEQCNEVGRGIAQCGSRTAFARRGPRGGDPGVFYGASRSRCRGAGGCCRAGGGRGHRVFRAAFA